MTTQAGYIALIADSSSLPKAEKNLDSLAATGERTERRVVGSMDNVSGSINRVGMSSGQHTMAMRNLAFQLNQIGQQGAVTGNYLGALAIQIPDILSSFGSLPLVLAGGAIAVGASLVPSLISGSNATADFDDALDELDAQIRSVQDAIEGLSTSRLQELFGDASEDARALAQSGLEISLRRQADAARALTEALLSTDNGFGLRNRARGEILGSGLDASTDELNRLSRAMQDLAAADGIDQQVEAAEAFRDLIVSTFGPVEGMTSRQFELFTMVADTERAWRRVRASVDDAESGQSAAARRQIADARTIIEQNEANAELMRAVATYGEDSAEADAVRRDQALAATEAYIDQHELTGDIAEQLRASASAAFDAEVGARAAAEGLSEAERAARALANAMAAAAGFSVGIEGQIATVRAQIDALGRGQDAATAGRIESLRQEASARRDAVLEAAAGDDEARMAAEERYQADLQNIGILGEEMEALRALQQVQRQGGAASRREHNEAMREAERVIHDIRTETEQYAAEVADLNELLEQGYLTQEQHARAVAMVRDEYLGLEEIQDTLKDAILDFAEGGEDAMENLGRAIRRAALEALLFGEGPLANFFGGGGLLSGLLGSITGGLRTGGGKATGGSVTTGTIYPVNENTTNTEWFAPAVAGTILTDGQAQGAVRGGGSSVVNINVNVDGANGDQHVMDLVAQGVRTGLSQYDRALPVRMKQIQANPRRR
ncbi:hypothetical protein C4N9_20950 [Pararhodobacter marinus]|uniref:Bacteriophage tail tape measure N-terminal domain-containing protein n=1 Tax=Pararhodobacter marinus TaxID=2184063 RepID=A0A2U2C4B5_9RHOB|nr:hypothetical protein [Pararhodobacter marinus]PWE26730.1 hypothetical protein C4N9_20950 [Pararhodobacter marinus]